MYCYKVHQVRLQRTVGENLLELLQKIMYTLVNWNVSALSCYRLDIESQILSEQASSDSAKRANLLIIHAQTLQPAPPVCHHANSDHYHAPSCLITSNFGTVFWKLFVELILCRYNHSFPCTYFYLFQLLGIPLSVVIIRKEQL